MRPTLFVVVGKWIGQGIDSGSDDDITVTCPFG